MSTFVVLKRSARGTAVLIAIAVSCVLIYSGAQGATPRNKRN